MTSRNSDRRTLLQHIDICQGPSLKDVLSGLHSAERAQRESLKSPTHTKHEHMRSDEKDPSFFTFAPVIPPSTLLDCIAECNKIPLSPFEFDLTPAPVTLPIEPPRLCHHQIETHNRDGDILISPGVLLIPEPRLTLTNPSCPAKFVQSAPDPPVPCQSCTPSSEPPPQAPPQVSDVAECSAQGDMEHPSSESSQVSPPRRPESPASGEDFSSRTLEISGSSALRSPPRPPDGLLASRTLDLVRKCLTPVTQGMSLRALREKARLLCTNSGDPVGVAIVEENDGLYMGPNNCLLISLQDILIPNPPQLRSMLIEFFCNLESCSKLPMASAILAIERVDLLEALQPDELTARCTEHITNDGYLPAELLTALLESAARDNTLGSILSAPSDIAFFSESIDRSQAKLVTSFQYPTESPCAVAMVMCSADNGHFDRLRPARSPSAVLTKASESMPFVPIGPSCRRAGRFAPVAAGQPAPPLHTAPEMPAPRSRFESKNRYAVLASDSREAADNAGARPDPVSESLRAQLPIGMQQARCHVRPRKPPIVPVHPGCFVPSGPRLSLPVSQPDKAGEKLSRCNPVSSSPPAGRRPRHPPPRTLHDFLPVAWALSPPNQAPDIVANSLPPATLLNSTAWPSPSEAARGLWKPSALDRQPALWSSSAATSLLQASDAPPSSVKSALHSLPSSLPSVRPRQRRRKRRSLPAPLRDYAASPHSPPTTPSLKLARATSSLAQRKDETNPEERSSPLPDPSRRTVLATTKQRLGPNSLAKEEFSAPPLNLYPLSRRTSRLGISLDGLAGYVSNRISFSTPPTPSPHQLGPPAHFEPLSHSMS